MLPVLDVGPTAFGFAHERIRAGEFVFCVQGDPHVTPQVMDGMAYIRKHIVTRRAQGVREYEVEGQPFFVQCIDLNTFSKDIGIERWGCIRFSGDVNAILGELAGPLAKTIIAGDIDGEVIRKLACWYRHDIGIFTLKEPL